MRTSFWQRLLVVLCASIGIAAVPAAADPQRPAAHDQANAAESPASDVLQRIRRHRFHPLEDGFTKDSELKRHGVADLADDDWRVRTLAIRDLATIGLPAVSTLLKGLTDDNLHVRHVAARVLGILPVEGEFAPSVEPRRRALEARLTSDPNPLVRSEAAIGLGRISDDASLALLTQAAEEDSSRDVRHQCDLAIDRLDQAESDDSVFEAYRALDVATFNTVSIGQPAVDFTLVDTDGLPWRLAERRGKKTVVLIWIFADWCPVCHGEFRDLVKMKQEFLRNDVEVVTIECHDRYRSRVMVGKEMFPSYWFAKQAPQFGYKDSLWWSHLADPAGAVAATYGAAPLAFAVHSEYVNRPSTVIIDKQGIVRLAYYGTYWGDRPSIEETLEMIRSGEFEFEHPKRLRSAKTGPGRDETQR